MKEIAAFTVTPQEMLPVLTSLKRVLNEKSVIPVSECMLICVNADGLVSCFASNMRETKAMYTIPKALGVNMIGADVYATLYPGQIISMMTTMPSGEPVSFSLVGDDTSRQVFSVNFIGPRADIRLSCPYPDEKEWGGLIMDNDEARMGVSIFAPDKFAPIITSALRLKKTYKDDTGERNYLQLSFLQGQGAAVCAFGDAAYMMADAVGGPAHDISYHPDAVNVYLRQGNCDLFAKVISEAQSAKYRMDGSDFVLYADYTTGVQATFRMTQMGGTMADVYGVINSLRTNKKQGSFCVDIKALINAIKQANSISDATKDSASCLFRLAADGSETLTVTSDTESGTAVIYVPVSNVEGSIEALMSFHFVNIALNAVSDYADCQVLAIEMENGPNKLTVFFFLPRRSYENFVSLVAGQIKL